MKPCRTIWQPVSGTSGCRNSQRSASASVTLAFRRNGRAIPVSPNGSRSSEMSFTDCPPRDSKSCIASASTLVRMATGCLGSLNSWILSERKAIATCPLTGQVICSWAAGSLRKDHLLFPRRTLLDKLGMDWTPIQSTWNKRYTELQSFKDAHGHCNVPGDWPENPQLGLWVSNQRQRSHRLTTLQMRLLTRLGFDWNPAETIWKTHLRELREFKRRFGHHNVAPRWSENPALASWVADLRARGKKAVPARRRRDLDVLGFEWAPLRAQWWETPFRELQVFKKRLGHCNVPKDWPANPALGNWVSTQRTQRRELPLGRRRRLDQLGFTWQLILMSPRKRWEERYQELVAFKKRFGHCDVPAGWPENRHLAGWGLRQRTRDKSKLTGDQKRRLNELNFCWGRREANWEERITELVAFKRKHGRSDVPKNWPQNPRLGQWVLRQRYRKHTLSAQRIDKLDRLGFRWPQNPARRRLR